MKALYTAIIAASAPLLSSVSMPSIAQCNDQGYTTSSFSLSVGPSTNLVTGPTVSNKVACFNVDGGPTECNVVKTGNKSFRFEGKKEAGGAGNRVCNFRCIDAP